MEITGEIVKKLPLENGTSKAGKAWEKLEFILKLEGNYPTVLAISTFKGEWIQFINDTSVGTMLKCNLNVNSREYLDKNGKERWSHNVTLWKAEVMSGEGNEVVRREVDISQPSEDSDLPF